MIEIALSESDPNLWMRCTECPQFNVRLNTAEIRIPSAVRIAEQHVTEHHRRTMGARCTVPFGALGLCERRAGHPGAHGKAYR
jgi:hypothetical protein